MTSTTSTSDRVGPAVTASARSGRSGRRPLVRLPARGLAVSSLALAAGKVAQMGLGFVFWALAARTADTAAVGAAGAVTSAVMLVTQIALVGVGAALITHLPTAPDGGRLLGLALLIVSTTAVGVAAVMVLLGAVGVRALQTVTGHPGLTALFLLTSVAGTASVMLDNVSMSRRHGHQVLARNLLSGVVVLVALAATAVAVDGGTHEQALVAVWCAGPVLAVGQGLLHAVRDGLAPRLHPDRRDARLLLDASGPNYVLTLTERAPGLVLPIVVVQLLSTSANAHWYVVWMLAWAVFVLPVSIGIGLFAEGRIDPAGAADATRRALRLALWTSGGAAAALAVAAPFVLGLLGPDYAASGTWPLRILLLGALPFTVVQVWFGACRAARALREATVLALALLVLSLAASAAAAAVLQRLEAVAAAWTLSTAAVGAVAALRLRSRLAIQSQTRSAGRSDGPQGSR